jgi:hypothetical protein
MLFMSKHATPTHAAASGHDAHLTDVSNGPESKCLQKPHPKTRYFENVVSLSRDTKSWPDKHTSYLISRREEFHRVMTNLSSGCPASCWYNAVLCIHCVHTVCLSLCVLGSLCRRSGLHRESAHGQENCVGLVLDLTDWPLGPLTLGMCWHWKPPRGRVFITRLKAGALT